MNTKNTENYRPLDEVLYAFAAEERKLNADLLEEYVRAYPEYAQALTKLAVDLALEGPRSSAEPATVAEMTTVTPAVSRAMSKFQNRLYELSKPAPTTAAQKANVDNPFLSLDKNGFRAVAQQLHANTVFVGKLRDRQIEPSTMTPGFLQAVGTALKAPLDVVIAHLNAGQSMHMTPQFHKSEEKPHVVARQSFADAVRGSGLDEEQQRHLLSL